MLTGTLGILLDYYSCFFSYVLQVQEKTRLPFGQPGLAVEHGH